LPPILPKLTIITSTLNCADKLRKTALSIREQDYKAIEWIIADGASTDGTLDVIAENSDIVSAWFSERDTGIYGAWNSARKYVNGDWVMFLGAGDIFQEPGTLSEWSERITTVPANYNFAFGNLKISDGKNHQEIRFEGLFAPIWMDLNPSTPTHSSTFTRGSMIKAKPFDPSFKIIGDRMFMIQNSDGLYYNLEMGIVIMDAFGVSNNPANIPLIWKENIKISRSNKLAPPSHRLKAYIINYSRVIIIKTLGAQALRKIERLRER
jgi:glycosyltransferase involved in cell wall biosynthesis